MKKIIVKVFCTLLCVSLMPLTSFAALSYLDVNMLINSSFNSQVTYTTPEDVAVNAKLSWIDEYRPGDKGVVLSGEKSTSTLTYDIKTSNEFVFSFDVHSKIDGVSGSLYIKDSGSNKQNLLNFEATKRLKTHNGRHIGGFNEGSVSNVAIVFNPSTGAIKYYFNGKCVIPADKITSNKVTSVAQVVFEFQHTEKSAILLDNINMFEGSEPLKSYPVDEYIEDASDPISEETISFEPVVGSAVMHKSDFEIPHTLSISRGGNHYIEVEEEDGNHALHVRQVYDTGDPHINAFNLGSESDYIVYEFRVKPLSDTAFFNLGLEDENDEGCMLAYLAPGRLMYMGEAVRTLQLGQWYKVSIVIDYYDRKIHHYFEGEHVSSGDLKAYVKGTKAIHMRFHMSKYNAGGTVDLSTTSYDFMLDDIHVYDGKEPVENLGNVEKVIKLTNRTVFDNNNALRRKLKDYYTLHTRSGVVCVGGEKDILMDTPHDENGVKMVNAAELSQKLGVENPYTEKYVPAEKYFTDGLGLQIYTDKTCLNEGMIIAGKSKYTAPTNEEELQQLNDFLWLLHPTDEVITNIYNASPMKGQHPRIHANAEDFARLREEIKTDPYKQLWSSAVIGEANNIINQAVVFYELRDGSRLLSVSREVEKKLYALSMAYQLTGEQKYVDRAWKELEAVCAFPDWHPAHALDVGEMAPGVAVAYDWMYHAFTPEQRQFIEKGIYNNCLYDANILYETAKGQMSTLCIGDSNWVNVTAGGMSIACLAVMDVYPEIATRVLGGTVKAMSNLMWRFAPYGSWYEGPGYWDLTYQYTVKMLDGLDTVFGTTLGLDSAEGLQYAAEAELQQQSPFGIYNYGDGGEGTKVYNSEMIWLAHRYNADAAASITIKNAMLSNGEDYALALLWKESDFNIEESTLDLDKYYEDAYVRVMRDTWEGDEQTFVGVHAGPTHTDHLHLDGASFVFDSMGVRWARDIGMGNYNAANYWDEKPGSDKWKMYRMRAESHNTIVINQKGSVEDHVVDSDAPFTKLESKPKGTITVVDTTDLFIKGVKSGKRGFAFCDNRTSLVIRDEVNVDAGSDIYWFMLTGANVAIDGNKAILTQDGRRLQLEFTSNVDAKISVERATYLPDSPRHVEDKDNETVNRIMIHANAGGEVNITVKLTPYGGGLTSVSDWDKPIDTWTIEDGEIPAKPKLESINVGSDNVAVASNTVDYYYLEGTLTSVPEITASSDVYDVKVTKGGSLNDITFIDVTDKNDSRNTNRYSLVFHSIPAPKQFDGMTSIPITSVVASAEPQEANRAINVLDNDLNTRWSADGAGCTLTLDLASVQTVDNLAIAFASGDVRSTRMEIALSADGSVYDTVFTGLSSGKTLEHEFFSLGGKKARYIKLTFNGNTSSSSSQWNSVTEVVVTRNN
ncbi:MAG: heparinase II/III family protein [Clostridia bacterium]|nr:heparinase II/III family protein [Clostridia bacterium]